MATEAARVKLMRGTEGNRGLVTPVQGELIATTDMNEVFLGDGTTPGGHRINPYNMVKTGVTQTNAAHAGSLAWWIAKAAGEDMTLLVTEPITVTGDMTIPENVLLKFEKGGKVIVSENQTLTVNGPIEAGLWHIFDGDGSVVGTPHSETLYPEWFGAVGDGITDDTTAIQTCLDLAGSQVKFKTSAIYLVKKTNRFTEHFPKGDQPCLFLCGKDGLSLIGNMASLKVVEHAQGILEVHDSKNMTIEDLTFIGAGNFPLLDGDTGRGEKGVSDAGYYTQDIWGFYKNNSLDTSAYDDGGYDGDFPQWGSGTASSWGEWNGGYIGNVAYGLLLQNGCISCKINNCEAYGFNYAGISVGHIGDTTYPDSDGIVVDKCLTHDNYSCGINCCAVSGLMVECCRILDIGHPSVALDTDALVDPGYGIVLRRTNSVPAKDVIISKNIISDCARKGIDSHSHSGATVTENIVSRCGYAGIDLTGSAISQPTRKTIISNNQVYNCGILKSKAASCSIVTSSVDSTDYEVVISNNLIMKTGRQGIIVGKTHGGIISNNLIKGTDEVSLERAAKNSAIYMEDCAGVTCNGNVIEMDEDDAKLSTGIVVITSERCAISNNLITMPHSTAEYGIRSITSPEISVYNNSVTLGASGVAYSLPNINTITAGNNYSGGASISGLKTDLFTLGLTFNGTVSPSPNVISGSGYFTSVSSNATGIALTLTLPPKNTDYIFTGFSLSAAGGIVGGEKILNVVYVRSYIKSESSASLELGFKTAWDGSHIAAQEIATGYIRLFVKVA